MEDFGRTIGRFIGEIIWFFILAALVKFTYDSIAPAFNVPTFDYLTTLCFTYCINKLFK